MSSSPQNTTSQPSPSEASSSVTEVTQNTLGISTPAASAPLPSESPASSSPAIRQDNSSDLAVLADDGFAQSVPFQALNLRINRSKGEFQLEGDTSARAEVYLVPRGSVAGKSYYGLPYDPKTPHDPSCQSPDGTVGYGWIDVEDQTARPRKCATCPRKGFGAGTCDDLQTLLAFDVERQVPVLVTVKNAEINPRKGVFTLAVNRMRSLGLKPTEVVFKLSFVPGDGPYSLLQIDVQPIAETLSPETQRQIVDTLNNCWAPFKQAQDAEAAELQELLS